MQLRDLLLPLLAALWALCTIVFNGTKELNFIRDRIMFADAEGFRATLPNRKLLAWNDWLPLLMLMIFACIAFGAVSGFSPMLLAAADRLASGISFHASNSLLSRVSIETQLPPFYTTTWL
jgi:hypothetical protein